MRISLTELLYLRRRMLTTFLHLAYSTYMWLISAGSYIYIETSGQRQGNKARLISPQIPPLGSGGQKCVKFWYHMYGQHVASLNLYIQFGLSLPSSPQWTLSGTQGNQWKMATLTFTATKPFNVSSSYGLLILIYLIYLLCFDLTSKSLLIDLVYCHMPSVYLKQ